MTRVPPDQIQLSDWRRLLFGTTPALFLVEVLLRTLFVYVVLIAIVRILGKRMAGQLTITEMAVMVTLGAIVSAAVQMPQTGVLAGAWLLICILALHRTVVRLGVKSRQVEVATQGDVICLVHDGEIRVDELKKAALSREQLFASLRGKNVRHLGEIERLYLEACGLFSIVRTRTERPGLSVLPSTDGTILESRCRAVPESLACMSCGRVVDVRHMLPACPSCGANDFRVAVR